MKTAEKMSTREVVLVAMITAATVVIARTFIIPVPMTHGNVNLCDAGIFIAALLLGRRDGAIVGGLAGFLLDLISGYSQYMLFSLVVHGLEGFVAGAIGYRAKPRRQIVAVIVAVIVMVVGYFVSDSILYQIPVGILGVPMNLVQGLVGAVVGYLMSLTLKNRLSYLS